MVDKYFCFEYFNLISADYCNMSLSSQMLAALLMTEEILESLVNVSLSTTRMCPSLLRTQDTDLRVESQSNEVRFKLMRLFWLKINHRLRQGEILVTQRYSH